MAWGLIVRPGNTLQRQSLQLRDSFFLPIAWGSIRSTPTLGGTPKVLSLLGVMILRLLSIGSGQKPAETLTEQCLTRNQMPQIVIYYNTERGKKKKKKPRRGDNSTMGRND